jgi:Preprotein translocase subunit SecB
MTTRNPKTTAKKTSRELADYTEFLKSLDLSGIALAESKVTGDRTKYLDVPDHEISMGWRCKPFAVGKSRFDVRADLTVAVSKPKSDIHFFDLTASYVLHIHAGVAFPYEHVERFCSSEVRLIIWPYFREYVASVCSRMHIPPVILPLANRA